MGETSNGHKKWGDWFFDYGVFGTEGLCLVDGHFRGQRMFNKLSLPVIRVKYLIDEFWGGISATWPFQVACGPYNDQITWDTEDFGENLNPIAGPHHLVQMPTSEGDRYIAIEPILFGGVPHLEISVYARIGAYHIKQLWWLNNDGRIQARVFSKGLSCNLDHWHHPYWRFDFALGSPSTHRLSVFHKDGPEIADIAVERGIVNSAFSPQPEYFITSTQPRPDVGRIEMPARAIITPPDLNDHEGIVGPTSFAPLDGYVRIFRPEEDRPWPHSTKDDIRFDVHDSCADKDIVFWSICHLKHHASEGKDHWHRVGPDILFRPMLVADIPKELLRAVDITSEIHVKDFKLVGKDLWQHSSFSESLLVNPNQRSGEAIAKLGSGDVTGELVLRVTWNPDGSVNLQFTANLFDETERVARVEGQFNVLRDTTAKWGGIHLVDHHKGDPDTADMSFEIRNRQQ
jgi:hypothetical protein